MSARASLHEKLLIIACAIGASSAPIGSTARAEEPVPAPPAETEPKPQAKEGESTLVTISEGLRIAAAAGIAEF